MSDSSVRDTERPAGVPVEVTINGEPRGAVVEPRRLLSDFLRHDLELTGTHVGCEGGACGACTVIIDGTAARSCLAFAVQASGSVVETVESLGTAENLHPLQAAFSQEHALQCGFCTPGILMALIAAEREGVGVDGLEAEILGGHMCSCTGYAGIRAAIRAYVDGSSGRG